MNRTVFFSFKSCLRPLWYPPVLVCLGILISVFPLETFAQIPDGYYDAATGKTGDDLKLALYNIIKGHTEYPYSSTSTDVWDILKEADQDPDDPTKVIGIYSGFSMDAAKEYDGAQGWNREHVWAKSRGDFGTTKGPGTDLHHMRAADVSTNSARNNRNFDECTVQYVDNSGNYSGTTESYTGDGVWTWEPRDEVKGDVARMIFYMATRYEGENGEPDLELVDYLLDNTDKSSVHGRLSVLLTWHEQDPVSDSETSRNEVVYSYQNNRNPYIDHPEYIAEIWGTSTSNDNPEPDEHITSLTIDHFTDATITLSWTDAGGTNLPDGFVIKASTTSFADIFTPTDGTTETASTLVKSVSQGSQQVEFTGLDFSTTYYFKVFPYANYGSAVDYKTDGTIPTVSQQTSEEVVCNPAITSFSPQEAPAGSLIQITGSNLSGTSTVTFGTVAASSFEVISDSQVNAYVPTDAESGNITVTTSCDAVSSDTFTFTAIGCSVTASKTLFISEYGEGSSYNKYLELYNGTGNTLDLSNYSIKVASNGNTTYSSTISLSGTLEDGAVYLVTHSSADASLLSVADLSTGSLSFNGDDYVGLFENDVLIDEIGTLGTDPGTGWTVAGTTNAGADQTLTRKAWAVSGNTDWTSAAGTSTEDSEWEILTSDTWTNMGSHTSGIDDLFFSEYAEGSSYNKYVEIYNGTGAAVDLSAYSVQLAFNGGASTTKTISLSGTLTDGDVYIIAHTSSDATIQAAADLLTGNLSFNGDDYVGLYNTGVVIDQIGVLGTDPGTAWDVAGTNNGTSDHTLVRKNTVVQGNTDWTSSSGTDASDSEWIVKASDYWDELDTHTFGSGSGTATASVSITEHPSSQEICQGSGATFTVSTDITNPAYQWRVFDGVNAFSDLTEGGIYSGTQSATLSISDVTGLENYQFYCLITDMDAGCSSNTYAALLNVYGTGGGSGVWSGSEDSDWFNCKNWEDGQVPTDAIDVIISSGESITLSANGTCQNLELDGGTLNLTGGADLLISGNVDLLNSGSIEASASGSSISFTSGTHQMTAESNSIGTNTEIIVSNGTTLDMQSDLALPLSSNQLIVESGGTLSMNDFIVSGSGNLDLQAGGKLIIEHVNGLSTSGNLPLTGTLQLSSDAIYEYAAVTNAQSGELLPASVAQLIVNQSSGSLSLINDLTISNSLTLTSGNLNTNGHAMTFSSGASLTGEQDGRYVLGEIRCSATIDASSSYQSDFGGIGLSIDGSANSQDLGSTQVVRFSGAGESTTVEGNTGINRRWEITPTSQPASGQPVDVTFSWVADDLNGTDLSLAQVWRREGTDPWILTGAAANYSGNSATVSTDQFSEWTVTESGTTLPVSWVSFKGELNKQGVMLYWTTASEMNNKGFEVERSADGETFEKAGFVNGVGNSNQPMHYHFELEGQYKALYFRLKQVDFDGGYQYSDIVYLVNDQYLLSDEGLQNKVKIWPNPSNAAVHLNVKEYSMYIYYSLYDTRGGMLARFEGTTDQVEKHLNELLNSMPAGIYYLRMMTREGVESSQKVVRQ